MKATRAGVAWLAGFWAACADPAPALKVTRARPPRSLRTTTVMVGISPAPELENVAQPEVELPAGFGSAILISSIEPVAEIEPKRAQRGDDRRAETDTAEEPGWVVLSRPAIEVPRIAEHVDVDGLAEPGARFEREGGVRFPERLRPGLAAVAQGVKSARTDREFFVAPKRDAVLHSTHRIQFRVERPHVPDRKPLLRGEAERELHPPAELVSSAGPAQGRVPPPFQVDLLVVPGAAQHPTVLLRRDGHGRSRHRERQPDPGVPGQAHP